MKKKSDFIKNNDTNWELYFQEIEHFFSIVENKKVLELSSFTGHFWPYILKYKPMLLEGLEPANIDKFVLPDIKVHKIGYEDFLPNKNYDVIMSFGLVYKLSNPLDLIERLANSNPEYILFEDIKHFHDNNDSGLGYGLEIFNELGNLIVDEKKYKKVPWNLSLPIQIIVDAFKLLGYELIKYQDVTIPDHQSKKRTCVLLLKKKV